MEREDRGWVGGTVSFKPLGKRDRACKIAILATAAICVRCLRGGWLRLSSYSTAGPSDPVVFHVKLAMPAPCLEAHAGPG